ncbi:MAG: RNA chaperone Hfq [Lautropia sp.]
MGETTDPDDGSTPDAPTTSTPDSTTGGSTKVNDQFGTLNRFRREKTRVDVYLVNGLCLHGQIKSFDRTMMLLESNTGEIALFLHAISTVARAQKRTKARGAPGGAYRAHESRDASGPRIGRDRPLPRRYDDDDADHRPAPPPRQAPQVIIKGRRSRSIVKPD